MGRALGLLRGILVTLATGLVATFVVHVLFFFTPPDLTVLDRVTPCYDIGAEERFGVSAADDRRLGRGEELALLFTSYVGWLRCAAAGSFGHSFYTLSSYDVTDSGDAGTGEFQPVTVARVLLGPGIADSPLLVTTAMLVLGVVCSTALSLAMGWRLGGRPSRAIRFLSGGFSMLSLIPVFILAFVLRQVLREAFGTEAPGGGVVLPWWVTLPLLGLLLAVGNGIYHESVESVTAAIQRERSEPYVRALIARRIPLFRHILTGAIGVLVGISASNLPRLLTVVVILEWTLNIRGMGYEGLSAFKGMRCDVPVILGVTAAMVVIVRVFLALQRWAIRTLNPRVVA